MHLEFLGVALTLSEQGDNIFSMYGYSCDIKIALKMQTITRPIEPHILNDHNIIIEGGAPYGVEFVPMVSRNTDMLA